MALSEQEIKQKLSAYHGWELKDNNLQKVYRCKDFISGIDLVNKIAVIAEQHDHHPDIAIHYNQITISSSTWSESSITEKDFKLIKDIEALTASTI